MKQEYNGWAIEARSSGTLARAPFLLGRYWYADLDSKQIPTYMEGHIVCLFKTRALARKALPNRWSVNDNHHWYVPVKIRVTVTEAQG